MIRKAFLMSVNPGSEAEYQQRHSPIWPELEQTLKDHGAHNYTIFLDAETQQLRGRGAVECYCKYTHLPEMVGAHEGDHAVKSR
jgi:L-rhamnose mutarotase